MEKKHLVVEGDNLFRIALKYGVSLEDIMKANKMRSKVVGLNQELIIPDKEAPKPVIVADPKYATKLVLPRFKLADTYSLGILKVRQAERWDRWHEVFSCKTLELPWKDNMDKISCIPADIYPIVFEFSPNFKTKLWEIYNVPDRDEAKIHNANYASQLLGCVAVGREHIDMNGDGTVDVTDSVDTLNDLHKVLEGFEYLTIEISNEDEKFV